MNNEVNILKNKIKEQDIEINILKDKLKKISSEYIEMQSKLYKIHDFLSSVERNLEMFGGCSSRIRDGVDELKCHLNYCMRLI